MAAQGQNHPIDTIDACVSLDDILLLKNSVSDIRVSAELMRYIVDIVGATRNASGVDLGASPRASLALMKAAQALALFDDLEFVTPEHIQEIAAPVIAHRMVLDPQARFAGLTAESIVAEILKTIKVPV